MTVKLQITFRWFQHPSSSLFLLCTSISSYCCRGLDSFRPPWSLSQNLVAPKVGSGLSETTNGLLQGTLVWGSSPYIHRLISEDVLGQFKAEVETWQVSCLICLLALILELYSVSSISGKTPKVVLSLVAVRHVTLLTTTLFVFILIFDTWPSVYCAALNVCLWTNCARLAVKISLCFTTLFVPLTNWAHSCYFQALLLYIWSEPWPTLQNVLARVFKVIFAR